MGKKISIIIILFNLTLPLFSQTGGDNVYEFLNLTHSGLVSSLGGSNVSLTENNLNMAHHNPALLSNQMDRSFVLNYANYFAGINYGQVIYSRTFQNAGSFGTGITYLDYGTFTGSDPSGVITGTFSASEYAFLLIWSHKIDSLFSIGVDLKPVLSHLENYTSFGIAFDMGASWHNSKNLFSAGLVFKNVGYQITSYAGEPHQKLPFEIQAGISQKLAHAPFRFSLTLRHLEKYDLTYQYSDSASSANQGQSEFVENVIRHVIVGTEIIPHKNFYFSVGYNYQRRRELQINSNVGTVGFSWGFGIRTSILDIEFGRATYHLAGSSNHVSLIIRPDKFYNRSLNE
jgi:hypothetical protein